MTQSQISVTTPLLTHIDPESSIESPTTLPKPQNGNTNGHGEGDEFDSNLTTTAVFEARLIAKNALPLTATYFLQYSFSLTTILFMGHVGTAELGALSLATMTANVTGLAVFEGLASSLDTLCSQAFGSGKKQNVGLHLQRMVLLVWLACIPIGIIWFASPWILSALVPEKEVAHLAGYALRIIFLGAPGYGTFEAGKRFVQAQTLFRPSLYVLCLIAPVNVLLNYLFIIRFSWGLAGAASALAISNNLLPLTLLGYCFIINPSTLECWPGLTSRAFSNWAPMLRLSLPGILMVESEWLAFDALTFSASYLSKQHLAAQSVLMSTAVIMYHIPFPAGVAVSTRLGNLIGEGALQAAKIATKTYVLIFAGLGAFDVALLFSIRHVLPLAYTSDPVVIRIVRSILPLVAMFELFDATTALANAILRGLGRQSIGGWTNLSCYYVIALPLALGLAFGRPGLGLWGLWIGPAVGQICVTSLQGVVIWWMDWRKCVREAKGRLEL